MALAVLGRGAGVSVAAGGRHAGNGAKRLHALERRRRAGFLPWTPEGQRTKAARSSPRPPARMAPTTLRARSASNASAIRRYCCYPISATRRPGSPGKTSVAIQLLHRRRRHDHDDALRPRSDGQLLRPRCCAADPILSLLQHRQRVTVTDVTSDLLGTHRFRLIGSTTAIGKVFAGCHVDAAILTPPPHQATTTRIFGDQ